MQRRMLIWLRWDSAGEWQELALSTALPASVDHLSAMPGGACLLLADASWWYLVLPRQAPFSSDLLDTPSQTQMSASVLRLTRPT